MKRYLFLLLLTLPLCTWLLSCEDTTQNEDANSSITSPKNKHEISDGEYQAAKQDSSIGVNDDPVGIDSTVWDTTSLEEPTEEIVESKRRDYYGPDTTEILGITYFAFFDSYELNVVQSNGDAVLKVADLSPPFEFNDFNGDGFDDIRIHYNSNVPAVQDLLLFDKRKKNFVLVKNFQDVPDPKPIGETGYYYSYHRSGCADMSWDSDLFTLRNNKLNVLGNISVDCEIDTVYINKIKGGKPVAYQSKSLAILREFEGHKWGFIEDYWSKNYQKFK